MKNGRGGEESENSFSGIYSIKSEVADFQKHQTEKYCGFEDIVSYCTDHTTSLYMFILREYISQVIWFRNKRNHGNSFKFNVKFYNEKALYGTVYRYRDTGILSFNTYLVSIQYISKHTNSSAETYIKWLHFMSINIRFSMLLYSWFRCHPRR